MAAFYFFAVDTHLFQVSPTEVKAYPRGSNAAQQEGHVAESLPELQAFTRNSPGSDKMELPMTASLSIVIVIKQEKNKNHNGNY